MDLHYNLTNEFRSAEFVRTGDRPDEYQNVRVEPRALSQAQRSMLETLAPGTGHSLVLVNPEHPLARRSCYFGRYLKAEDAVSILGQLAAERLNAPPIETTQPITFRIHSALLDQVRAYQRDHGLKTDGATLRELIEKGLSA